MTKRRRSAADARSVSLLGLARLFGKHRNTVASWLSDGCPALGSARRKARVEWKLDPAAVLDWLLARERSRERERLEAHHAAEIERLRRALEAAEGDSATPVSRAEALRRMAVARARLAEFEVLEREDALLPADQVAEAWIKIAQFVRTRILAVPAKLAQHLAAATEPRECHEIVEAELYEVLTELSETRVEPAPEE